MLYTYAIRAVGQLFSHHHAIVRAHFGSESVRRGAEIIFHFPNRSLRDKALEPLRVADNIEFHPVDCLQFDPGSEERDILAAALQAALDASSDDDADEARCIPSRRTEVLLQMINQMSR